MKNQSDQNKFEIQEAFFDLGNLHFKGTIKDKIFILEKIILNFILLSIPKIELNQLYINKIIDKKKLMVKHERQTIKDRGIEYEN